MNAKELKAHREYFDKVHGVTMRAIGVLDDKDLDFRPTDRTRTIREILFHMYAVEKSLAEAVGNNEIKAEDLMATSPEQESAKAAVEAIRTVDDMKAFAEECHAAANRALAGVDDARLSGIIPSPMQMPGEAFVTGINDEHWHHRGQFYVYLRLLGKEPPMLYGYEG